MRRFLALAIVAAAPAFVCAQAGPEVSGTVSTVDGSAVANAMVMLVPATHTSTDAYLMAKSQTDGGFAIPNVPDGEYNVCVRSDGLPILDPCVWGGFPVRVSVAGGVQPNVVRAVVTQGAELAVDVQDPERQLAGPSTKGPKGPALSVGVFTPSRMFIPMPLASTAGSGRKYRILVPAGVPVRMVLASSDFEFEEPGAGPKLLRRDGESATAAVTVPKETAKAELVVSVKPKKQP